MSECETYIISISFLSLGSEVVHLPRTEPKVVLFFFFFSGAILRMQLSGLLTGNQVTGSPPSQALWGIYCGQKITFNTCEEHLF